MGIDAPRRAAAELLRQVDEDGAYANLALPGILSSLGLTGRDAAFATELAFGTLRWQGLYDVILDAAISGDPGRVEPGIRRVLRMGVHQLLGMRVPVHAAVDASVTLAKGSGDRAASRGGFVNAVLRAVSRRDLHGWVVDLELEGQGPSSVEQLSARWSHPTWIVRAFADALGERRGELGDLLAADNLAPRPVLVARPGRLSPQDLRAEPGVEPGRWSPLAGVLVSGAPDQLASIRSGAASVQDEGSQLMALALVRAEVSSSEGRWLDACAGPGGKAALLAGFAAQAGVEFMAVESHAHRVALIRGSLAAGEGTVLQADARTQPWRPQRFDRVLVDAPCTGIGALRRRPEARWRRKPADMVTLGPLQRDLLKAGLQATAPGGVLAYVTCSPHLAETESVVHDALRQVSGWEVIDARALLPEVADCGAGPYVQLWPHRHGTDAMFLAMLQRNT